jgi:hypothetical protein
LFIKKRFGRSRSYPRKTGPSHYQEYIDVITESLRVSSAIGLLAATIGALAGCAAAPVPNEKLAVAQASVQRAEQAGAPQLAPVEMATAREKLTRAQAAAADHKPVPATQLAEQANVDAQLAEATATRQKSMKAAAEFDASMQALRSAADQNSLMSN